MKILIIFTEYNILIFEAFFTELDILITYSISPNLLYLFTELWYAMLSVQCCTSKGMEYIAVRLARPPRTRGGGPHCRVLYRCYWYALLRI